MLTEPFIHGQGASADIDSQRDGAMITLVFSDASQIVINLQKPLHEVWLAARSGGYHFRFADSAWRDTRSGEEFFACLSRSASQCAGVPLQFAPG